MTPLIMATTTKKLSGIYIMKKTTKILKNILKGINRWRAILYSWMLRLIITKM